MIQSIVIEDGIGIRIGKGIGIGIERQGTGIGREGGSEGIQRDRERVQNEGTSIGRKGGGGVCVKEEGQDGGWTDKTHLNFSL